MSTDPNSPPANTLDVRELDGEPFDDIMAMLDELAVGETFVLINHFEPEPLYAVLERRGYTYDTSRVAEDEWRVSITNEETCSGE